MATWFRDTRRILTSLGLLILLGGGGIVVSGFATAEEGTAGLPATWSIPPPKQGDQAVYEPVDTNSGQHRSALLVEAHPRTTARDAEGARHLVMPLTFQYTEASRQGGTFNWSSLSMVDITTGDAVSYERRGFAHPSASDELVDTGSRGSAATWDREYPDQPRGPCAFGGIIRGQVLDVSQRLPLYGCGHTRTPSLASADRLEDFRGLAALVYSTWVPLYGKVDVWFAQELPFPVKVQWTGSLADSWQMVGFAPGRLPYGTGGAFADPRPATVQAPFDRYGPTFEGMDVEIPLQDAIAAIQADPEGATLAAAMEQDEGWFVRYASYSEGASDWSSYLGWWLMLEAGGTVWRAAYLEQEQHMTLTGDLAVDDPTSGPVVDIQVEPSGDLPLAQVPATLPTITSVAAVWVDEEGPNAELRHFGFSMDRFSCEDCSDDTFSHVFAGDVEAILFSVGGVLPAPIGAEQQEEVSAMVVDGTGSVSHMIVGYRFTDPGGVRPTGVVEGTESVPVPASIPAELWQAPQATFVAGAGIVALFVSVAYYLWPALKSGPAALFTRLQKPKLLEHPRRQVIMDAVAADPGIHYKQLQRATGLAYGGLRHHVQHLVRAELLVEKRHQGYTCFFPPGTGRVDQARAAARSEGAQRVLQVIIDHPGSTTSDVARRAGLSMGTVSYHATRLEAAGALERRREGRSVRMWA